MITFTLVIALVDRFVGEFDSKGTSLLLVVPALGFSVLGLVRGLRLISFVYYRLTRHRELPGRNETMAVLNFVALQLAVVSFFIIGEIAPDDYSVLLSGCCFGIPSRPASCHREIARRRVL